MTVALSSLRVVADLDTSAYTRAIGQKVAADTQGTASSKAVGQALAQTDAAMDKASTTVARLNKTFIDGYGSAAKAEQAFRNIGRALDTGGVSMERASLLMDGVVKKFGVLPNATALAQGGFVSLSPIVGELNARYSQMPGILDKVVSSHKEHAAAAGMSQMALMELEHSGRAMIDMLGAGIPVTRALMMEGPRLAQAFGNTPGGVGGVFKSLGTTLSNFLTPTRLVAGELLALGAVGASAYLGWEHAQDRLATSLNGVGRESGLTLGRLEQLAQAGSREGGITVGDARGLVAGYASSGRIGPEMNLQLTDLTKRYSEATGTDLQTAGSTLAQAFSDPLKGADKLNERLGFLNASSRDLIQTFQSQGDMLDAQRTLFQGVASAVDSAADRTWRYKGVLDQLKDNWSQNWSNAGANIASMLGDETTQHRLAQIETELQGYREAQEKASGGGLSGFLYGVDQSKLDGLQAEREWIMREQAAEAALKAQQAQQVKDNRESLEGQATQRVTQDSQFSVASILAQTGAQRTAIEAERARTEAIRSNASAATAAAEATAKWSDAIAQSARTAREGLQQSQDRAGMLFLSPLQQQIQEENNRYRDQQRDMVTGPSVGATGGYASLVAAHESRGDAGIVNPNGGAAGLYQFMPATWAGLMRAHPELGLTPGGATDPTQANAAMQAFTGDNARTLSRAGFQTSDQNLFMAHFLGAGGAVNFLRDMTADPTQSAASLFPREAAQNRNDFYGPGGVPRSLGDLYSHMTQSFDGAGMRQSTAASDAAQAHATNLATIQTGAEWNPIFGVDKQLAADQALETVKRNTYGQSTEAVTEAIEKQKMLNTYMLAGVKPTGDMNAAIEVYAKSMGQLAKQQEEDAKRANELSGVRGGLRDALGTGLSDLESGKGFGTAGKDMLKGIADKLQSSMLDSLTGILTGTDKNSSGGLIGGLLKGFLGFADGGIMTAQGAIPLHRYAAGGIATSPQLAMFGEGRQPEAYVPLPDGRSIPVNMRMSAAATASGHTFNIAGSTFVVQGDVSERSEAKIKMMLDQRDAVLTKKIARSAASVQNNQHLLGSN